MTRCGFFKHVALVLWSAKPFYNKSTNNSECYEVKHVFVLEKIKTEVSEKSGLLLNPTM